MLTRGYKITVLPIQSGWVAQVEGLNLIVEAANLGELDKKVDDTVHKTLGEMIKIDMPIPGFEWFWANEEEVPDRYEDNYID